MALGPIRYPFGPLFLVSLPPPCLFVPTPCLSSPKQVDLFHMDVDGPEQPLARTSPIAPIFRGPSPQPSRSWENLKRASLSSQVSSRRSSTTPRRRRLDAQRKSDASSYGDRRGSFPVVNFRPVEHPPGGLQQQPVTLPNYDPRIYEQLSTFTFGEPLAPPTPRSATNGTFSGSHEPPVIRRRSKSRSSEGDTDASVEEFDEEERIRAERSKLRAMDDGSRRPSLPINIPPGTERRRSTVAKLAYGIDGIHMDDVPEERMQETSSLPARLEPKPLPALPLSHLSPQSPFLRLPQPDLRSRLENFALNNRNDFPPPISAPSSNRGSPKPGSGGSDAPSPPNSNAGDGRESSPAAGGIDTSGFQAILDHEWGTAFHIPGNISPRSSIEDPFMKMIEQLDPVYNRNRYAWTFKKIPTMKKPIRALPPPTEGGTFDQKGKGPEKEQPEVVMWNCQNVGQYGMWPGRATNGEHKRPSVLYAVSGEGGKRRGPTYLIHKHSRCHAFSIFQGYQVTGQKILASHAMLLSNKAIQYSFANAPEHKANKTPQKPHEPYENDPEVQKLQTHQLVDDEADIQRPNHHEHTHEVHMGSPKQTPKPHSSATPERTMSRKASSDLLRHQRAGPSSFAPTEIPKSELEGYPAPPEPSTTSISTLTPAPKVTSHAVAFDAIDPHTPGQVLNRASTTRFEWIRRAFGTGKVVGTAPRYPSQGGVPTTHDSPYSPPWLLMAPQAARQENERIIQNINDSFRAVGLIPTPKVKPPHPVPQKPKKPKNRSPIIESIPRDAMMMLMPLWIAEGGHTSGVAQYHVPMTERTYLLVYYVPFDSSARSIESSRSSTSGKKRTRHERDRPDRKRHTSPDQPASSLAEEEIMMLAELQPKKPKKCSFRVVARMLSYTDVRECGIKLPRFGLAVHGPLSDALLGNPSYHAVGENFSAVIAVCHGAEAGVELVTEGLDKLGLRRSKTALADEQQIALAAMQMDVNAMEEEHEARQQPLTPIGKSVVEMVFAGCVSILEVGFR
ncbi:hypothetical protein FRC14_000518 [Serendipita sp. 396]|nr:hypothetical protein FRC14_000518 [Serendipita sp. 396]